MGRSSGSGQEPLWLLGRVKRRRKFYWCLQGMVNWRLDFFVNFLLGSLNQGQGIKITYPFWNGFEFSPQTSSIHGQEGKGWQIRLAWNGTRVSENQRKIPVWENLNRIRTKNSVYIVKESDCLERITLHHKPIRKIKTRSELLQTDL